MTNPAVKPGDTSAGAVKPAEAAAPAVEVKPVYVPVTPTAPSREVIKSWNIGAPVSGVPYAVDQNGAGNGMPNVVATLYPDGELAITGTGDTVVFGLPMPQFPTLIAAPWRSSEYIDKIKSVSFAPGVKTTDISSWFADCKSLEKVSALPSSIVNASFTFTGCSSLKAAPELSTLQGLENTQYMFNGCASLVDPPSVLPENISLLQGMFIGCTNLNGTMVIKIKKNLTSAVMEISGFFDGTATASNARLTLNYTRAANANVDALLHNSLSMGKVVKGVELPSMELVQETVQVTVNNDLVYKERINAEVYVVDTSLATYKWYVKAPTSEEYTEINGATNNSYIPDNQRLIPEGTMYKCVVTSGNTTLTGEIKLQTEL